MARLSWVRIAKHLGFYLLQGGGNLSAHACTLPDARDDRRHAHPTTFTTDRRRHDRLRRPDDSRSDAYAAVGNAYERSARQQAAHVGGVRFQDLQVSFHCRRASAAQDDEEMGYVKAGLSRSDPREGRCTLAETSLRLGINLDFRERIVVSGLRHTARN